jgi:uroporphyrinogen-III synthase
MSSAFIAIIWPIIARQLVTWAGGAALGAAAYAVQHWGVTPTNAAAMAAGVVAAGSSAAVAVSKSGTAQAFMQRFPLTDILNAVAQHTSVAEIQVTSSSLADSVPAQNVVPAEGHTQAQV